MKKEIFTLTVENLEDYIIAPMEISKTEYKKQLKYLRERTKETVCEIQTEELPANEIDTECYIIFEHTFLRGCSFTTLQHKVCKEGYVFKPKNER